MPSLTKIIGRYPAAPYVALTLAVFAAYANIYGNGFVFDDGLLVERNEFLRSWSTFGKLFTAHTTDGAHVAGGFYRPLQNLLYFFVYQIFGPSPFGFHLADVALHAANAGLLFTLARRLGFAPLAAFFGALIWAVHPIQTEAITYTTGTADPLFVFFTLCGLIVLAPEFAPRKIAASCVFFALALLSKETAVAFPLLAAICVFLVNPQRKSLKTYRRTWPLWLMLVAYLLLRFTILNRDGFQSFALPAYSYMQFYAGHFSCRLYTFLATLPFYLGALVWPVGLHIERDFLVFLEPFHWEVLAGFLIIAAAAAAIIRSLKTKKNVPLSWGLLWAAAAYAPNAGLLMPVDALFLEHWMYLPTVGLFLGIAQTIALNAKKLSSRTRRIGIGAVLLLALALGVRAYDQNEVWRDTITLYNYIFTFGEGNARSHNNLGIAYAQKGDYAAAIDQFREAIRISDTMSESHLNLAITLYNLPDRAAHAQEAVAELERALAIDPECERAYRMLAVIADDSGSADKAQAYRARADEIAAKFR